jgi:hypothetical protein
MNANTPERFWEKVRKSGDWECWLWSGTKGTHGYGQFSYQGRIWRAHRLAFFLSFGWVAEVIAHKCDTPLSVNPRHLFGCTQADNRADCVSKGRQAKGETHGGPRLKDMPRGSAHYASRITEDDVLRIRQLSRQGLNYSQIAREFPLHPMTIGEIVRREIWKHVS